MRRCGVDIKGSEAIFAAAELIDGVFTHIPTDIKKIALDDDEDAGSVRSFSDLVGGFLRDNQLLHVVIKKRAKKGDYAGGPTTFKIEGVFQLLKDCRVELLSPHTVAAQERKGEFPSPASLNKYQADAFRTACAALRQATKP